MVDGTILIGALIIAVTQAVKYVAPAISGVLTMFVAVGVGILIALIDTNIGVTDISVAQGILIALAAVGVHTVASAVNTSSSSKI